MSKEIEGVLARVPLFAGVKQNQKALEHLSHVMEIKKYKAGTVLIQEGELGDEFFILIKGQVSIYRKTPEGDVYKVVILKSEINPAFGEGGLIEAEPRSATVTCDLESECLVLTRNRFLTFSSEHPEESVPILRQIAQVLMGRLKQTSHDLMLLHKALMNEIRQ